MSDETFREWCILELMGHRRLAGLVTEQEIAGAAFLRLDVYGVHDGPDFAEVDEEPPLGEAITTQFYSPSAVYCMTPTTEEIARQMGEKAKPRPVSRYELEPPRSYAGER